jgi:ABC-type transport system involved in multi-copper enzyme maturation permease subunit
MNNISILLWKEWRGNAHLLVLQAAALLLPIALVFVLVLTQSESEAPFLDLLAASLVYGVTFGLFLSQLVFLCLGGMLVGGERMSRTFEFLFNQPVSRSSIAQGKLIFGLGLILVVWILGGLISTLGLQLTDPSTLASPLSGLWFGEVAVVGLLLFSSSWYVSCKTDNPVLAITIGALVATGFTMLVTIGGARLESLFTIGDHNCARLFLLPIVSAVLIAVGVRKFVGRKSP